MSDTSSAFMRSWISSTVAAVSSSDSVSLIRTRVNGKGKRLPFSESESTEIEFWALSPAVARILALCRSKAEAVLLRDLEVATALLGDASATDWKSELSLSGFVVFAFFLGGDGGCAFPFIGAVR